jgi:DNA-binding CsgD family transcriptional regulator
MISNKILLFILLIQAFFCDNSLFAQKQDEMRETHKLVTHHINLKDYDSAIFYADKCIDLESKKKEPIDGYAKKIRVNISFNKLAKAYRLALETKQKYCELKENVSCNSCDDIYGQLSDLMTKIQNYKKAIEYLDLSCNKNRNSLFFYKKALLYIDLNQFDQAFNTTKKCIEIQLEKNNVNEQIHAYNQHGLIAAKILRYDEAITAYEMAIELIGSNEKNSGFKSVIQGNIGHCYFEKSELDIAFEYLLLDSKGSLNMNAIQSYAKAEILLSRIELRRKNYNSVSLRLKRLYENYQSKLSYSNRSDILEVLIESLRELGNTKDQVYYSDEWVELTKVEAEVQAEAYKNLFNAYSENSIASITQQMELEKELIEQKLLVQSTESERKELNSWILIGGLIAAMIIGILLFLRLIAIQSQKAINKEMYLKSARQEQEILKLKVENESKNVQALSLELELKEGFSTNLLNELSKLDHISSPELKNIEIFIQNELSIKSARAELHTKMGDLSSTFYIDLSIKHPELNEADLKLAAMLVINMSNKEIGVSKNITTASVKKTKTRLKRKLDLSLEDDLSDYLKMFLVKE